VNPYDATASLGRLSVESYGDRSEAFQVEVELSGDDLTVSVFVDIVIVNSGRGVALFTFVDVITPFSGERGELIEAVLTRLGDGA